MKKVLLDRNGQAVLSSIVFYLFGLERRKCTKRDHVKFSFYMSFSNSLNMKKISSYTFFGLIKLLNNIGFVTMTNMRFSFLGIVKLTRLDSSEG